jgi:hypothetical protein
LFVHFLSDGWFQLTPAHLRIGGTLGDTIIYEIGEHKPCIPGINCLNMTRWQQVLDFAWVFQINSIIVFFLRSDSKKEKENDLIIVIVSL